MAVQRGGTPPVHWSVWLFASIGLAFVLAGALNMVYAHEDPHAGPANAYASAVQSWVATGYKQFAADWSKGGVHLLLNHSYIDAAELEPGTVEPRSTRIWLNVSDTAAPLKGRHVNDQAQYSQVQWFNGTLPLWPYWNGRSTMITTRNIVVAAFAGAKLGDIGFTFGAITCSDAVHMVRCGSQQCPQYVRQMRFLMSAGLVVSPPSLLLPNKTHWKYDMDSCAQSYDTQEVEIDEPTYHSDVMQGDDDSMSWCANYSSLFTRPLVPAVITLRSSGDPFYVAGQVTNCSYMLPRPPLAIFERGFGLLLPGVVVTTLAYFLLAGVCDLGLGKPRPGDAAPLLRGRTVGAAPGAYGTTTALELTAGRRATGAPDTPAAV